MTIDKKAECAIAKLVLGRTKVRITPVWYRMVPYTPTRIHSTIYIMYLSLELPS